MAGSDAGGGGHDWPGADELGELEGWSDDTWDAWFRERMVASDEWVGWSSGEWDWTLEQLWGGFRSETFLASDGIVSFDEELRRATPPTADEARRLDAVERDDFAAWFVDLPLERRMEAYRSWVRALSDTGDAPDEVPDATYPEEETRSGWLKWAAPVVVAGVILGWVVLGGGDDGDGTGDPGAGNQESAQDAGEGDGDASGDDQPADAAAGDLPARQPDVPDGAADPVSWEFSTTSGDPEVFADVPAPSFSAGPSREGGVINLGGGAPSGDEVTGTLRPNGDGTARWEDRVFNSGGGADSQELTDVAIGDGQITGSITWTDTEGRTATADFTLTLPQAVTEWFASLPAAGPSPFEASASDAGVDEASGAVGSSITLVDADTGAPAGGVPVVAVLFVDGQRHEDMSGVTGPDGSVQFAWPDPPSGESFSAVVFYVGAHSIVQTEVEGTFDTTGVADTTGADDSAAGSGADGLAIPSCGAVEPAPDATEWTCTASFADDASVTVTYPVTAEPGAPYGVVLCSQLAGELFATVGNDPGGATASHGSGTAGSDGCTQVDLEVNDTGETTTLWTAATGHDAVAVDDGIGIGSAPAAAADDGGIPWAPIGLALALLAVAGAVVVGRTRTGRGRDCTPQQQAYDAACRAYDAAREAQDHWTQERADRRMEQIELAAAIERASLFPRPERDGFPDDPDGDAAYEASLSRWEGDQQEAEQARQRIDDVDAAVAEATARQAEADAAVGTAREAVDQARAVLEDCLGSPVAGTTQDAPPPPTAPPAAPVTQPTATTPRPRPATRTRTRTCTEGTRRNWTERRSGPVHIMVDFEVRLLPERTMRASTEDAEELALSLGEIATLIGAAESLPDDVSDLRDQLGKLKGRLGTIRDHGLGQLLTDEIRGKLEHEADAVVDAARTGAVEAATGVKPEDVTEILDEIPRTPWQVPVKVLKHTAKLGQVVAEFCGRVIEENTLWEVEYRPLLLMVDVMIGEGEVCTGGTWVEDRDVYTFVAPEARWGRWRPWQPGRHTQTTREGAQRLLLDAIGRLQQDAARDLRKFEDFIAR